MSNALKTQHANNAITAIDFYTVSLTSLAAKLAAIKVLMQAVVSDPTATPSLTETSNFTGKGELATVRDYQFNQCEQYFNDLRRSLSALQDLY